MFDDETAREIIIDWLEKLRNKSFDYNNDDVVDLLYDIKSCIEVDWYKFNMSFKNNRRDYEL